MSVLTMNTEEMDHLQQQFNLFAGQVEDLRTRLTATLESTTWTGSRSERFRGGWREHWSPSLAQLQEALVELASAISIERQNTIAALDSI
ncbi:MAG: WXG100 family type VII secretion target [Acidimicrobiia bacterium]|nr:WXG100 family type VII secretion target [Acidimicrobiia bacterium]MYC57152.1 WXG100 family type VII secretion target [Acidimicrobiia bacterium]MYG93921.1 WXG100 family type VII secretion target [Acidimicrobiia bacterium]MYI29924.1 WXG100 family type VII secretion target [Acidimicrobiia bacterium]